MRRIPIEQRPHPQPVELVESPRPARHEAPYGPRTTAQVLAMQRLAGNRAATTLLGVDTEPLTAPRAFEGGRPMRTVQRGIFSFLGDVAKAAGSYVADIGRGFKRSAKGLRVWNPDALVKQHEENASAGRLFLRLVQNPLGTIEAAVAGVVGGLATFTALPEPLRQKATDKFQDKAPDILKGILAKVIGKAIAQKALVAIANRILTSAVVKQLLKKLGASAAVSKTGVGIPLAVFSSLGLIEKAAGAADRLKAKYPEVYSKLAADDLHMLWFVIEPHAPAISAEVYASILDHIERTNRDGRELIDAGGSNDRTPIRSGPDRRTPIDSGGSTPRTPIRAGGG